MHPHVCCNYLSFFIPVSFDSSTVRTSCPTKDWRPHGGKCYWIAENENKKSWNESKNDCAMKNSHLMVIRDFTDMVRHKILRL